MKVGVIRSVGGKVGRVEKGEVVFSIGIVGDPAARKASNFPEDFACRSVGVGMRSI